MKREAHDPGSTPHEREGRGPEGNQMKLEQDRSSEDTLPRVR